MHTRNVLSPTVLCLVVFLMGRWAGAPAAAQSGSQAGAPETFNAQASIKSAIGAVTTTVQIVLDRYTPDAERAAVESALKIGGYPGFVSALRKAPGVGRVELGGQQSTIRWARQTTSPKGRTIVVVTERPVFFIGGGGAKSKPKEGYEVALVELIVDDNGHGTGSMAAAARIKLAPEGGVLVDDYADEMIALTAVTRRTK
jgi:hypothetical protein